MKIEIDTPSESLTFEGEKIAEVTSRRRGKTHWADVNIYSVDTGVGAKFVVHNIGRTLIDGQIDYHTLRLASTESELVMALRIAKRGTQTRTYWLPHIHRMALLQAAHKFPDIIRSMELIERSTI